MTELGKSAESCLIAVSVHLSLMAVRNENFPMWRQILRDLSPDCYPCAKPLEPVRDAAEVLANAQIASEIDAAADRLRREVQKYYEATAAYRHEKWSIQKSGEGRAA